jgi:2-hydroxychromene-2-carboxylate isomerase
MAATELSVDYFFATMSPWAYLGHQRFQDLLQRSGAQVRVRPVDLGEVFPASGGLPLAKRPAQRQAYRLQELRRFSAWLQLPLNPQPRFFPVNGNEAARLVIAVDMQDESAAAMRLSGAILAAVWAQERDIADAATLAALLSEQGLPAQRLQDAAAPAVQARFEADTQQAIAIGVFGAPSYVVDGEIFWGQDRLDFLERRLQASA